MAFAKYMMGHNLISLFGIFRHLSIRQQADAISCARSKKRNLLYPMMIPIPRRTTFVIWWYVNEAHRILHFVIRDPSRVNVLWRDSVAHRCSGIILHECRRCSWYYISIIFPVAVYPQCGQWICGKIHLGLRQNLLISIYCYIQYSPEWYSLFSKQKHNVHKIMSSCSSVGL